MASTISPNMSLVIPTVGSEPGPDWANDLNSSLNIVDSHTHAPGSGVPITPAAMSITSDLTFQNNNITNIKTARFYVQASQPAGVSDLDCLYVYGVDLYYRDGSGNQVRITQSGGVAGSPGSISGLVSPASATYVPANQTFVWQSDVATAAIMDCGTIKLRKLTASSSAISIAAPTGLSSNYTINLPTALPSANAVYQITSGGTSSFVGGYVPLFDAVIGSAAQVTGGIATHSTFASAIAAVSANGTIRVLPGAWTENVNVTKTLTILGSGYGSVVTGTLTLTAADHCTIKGIQFTGSVTLDSSTDGSIVQECFIGSSSTCTDNGTGNYIELTVG
jgi:uncharacterized protein YhbP (UPF0306 family)